MNTSINKSIDYPKVCKSIAIKNWIYRSVLITGVSLTLIPLLARDYLSDSIKSLMLGSGVICNLVSCFPFNLQRELLLKKTFEDLKAQDFREKLQGDAATNSISNQIRNEQKVVNLIERITPEYHQDYFANKYNVHRLLSSTYIEQTEAVTDSPSLPTQDGTTQKSLITLQPEHQWLYQLLKLPFKVLSGEQGSGKSTLERLAIDLLRQEGHYIIVVNPETIRQSVHDVLVLKTADKINEFFKDFPEMIRFRQDESSKLGIDEDDYLDHVSKLSGINGRVAIFLMETNTYEAHGVNPEVWATFLKQMTTNIRKWGFTGTLTAHADNQMAIASKLGGFAKLINGCPRVDCIATTDRNGETVSSGTALLRLKGKNSEPEEVELMFHKPPSKQY